MTTNNPLFEYNIPRGKTLQVRIIKDINEVKNKQNSINLIGFEQTGIINFRKEIEGKGKDLVNLGKHSALLGGITLVGGISDNCGLRKKSIFVFENGRLNCICDMNRYEDKYSTSYGYKIISYQNKKIGLLVDKDLYSPDAVKALILCGVGLIINLYEGFSAKKAIIASEFYSYVYGVDFIHFSQNQIAAFDYYGMPCQFENDLIDLECCGVFKETKARTRGF